MNSKEWVKASAAVLIAGSALASGGCGGDKKSGTSINCAPTELSSVAQASGSARVFKVDPMVASGNLKLSPTASNVSQYAQEVTLENLTGLGVLGGKYADVRAGGDCGLSYGAYDKTNRFLFDQPESGFQESMAYYWGDRYRSELSGNGALESGRKGGAAAPVQMIARYPEADNAFYYRAKGSDGAIIDRVCLGYSAAAPGAYYADDATVTVHELQHATTTNTYSALTSVRLNRFWYDEAGALNEAVSDFMALMFEKPWIADLTQFDEKVFSRWALGSYVAHGNGSRGAHRCPMYDPTFPACSGFPSFSADQNKISYVYPDGMGWPYASNYEGPGYASRAFEKYRSQEEIHNAGVLLEGALWDAYEAVRANHGGSDSEARPLMSRLVMEAIKHLPQSSSSSISPVTFVSMATQLSTFASAAGMSSADVSALNSALTARGLRGAPQLASTWAAEGTGNGATRGIRVWDLPAKLQEWLISMFGDVNAAFLVPQTDSITSKNSKLDPGELVAMWFDVANNDAVTAGSVQLSITILDPSRAAFDDLINGDSYVSSSQAQVIYGKINSPTIVTALGSANTTYKVNTGNSYFKTNPHFDATPTTALWVQISPNAAHGSTVRFQVTAQPSNGAASTVTFTATVN